MPRAVILGNDTAALLAAHACLDAGWTFDIFAEPEPEQLHGVPLLYERIPNISLPTRKIQVKSENPAGYSAKVHGPGAQGNVSVGMGSCYVLDQRSVYRYLWQHYATNIYHWVFSASSFEPFIVDAAHHYQAVFSSLPLALLCNKGHRFDQRSYFTIYDSPNQGLMSPVRVALNTVVLDGTNFVGWYRAANVFGHCSVEWPAHKGSPRPPIPGVMKLTAPVDTNCDCFPEVTKIGPAGTGRESETLDTVYSSVSSALARVVTG